MADASERVTLCISGKAMRLLRAYKRFPVVFRVLRSKHYAKQFYPDERHEQR